METLESSPQCGLHQIEKSTEPRDIMMYILSIPVRVADIVRDINSSEQSL